VSEAQKTVTYLVCDGCGYAIGARTEAYLILSAMKPGEERVDRHFHMPQGDNEHRSWGTRDCLGYWHVNRKARESGLSTGTDGVGGAAWKNALRELEKKP
jgi:hypothetical protein